MVAFGHPDYAAEVASRYQPGGRWYNGGANSAMVADTRKVLDQYEASTGKPYQSIDSKLPVAPMQSDTSINGSKQMLGDWQSWFNKTSPGYTTDKWGGTLTRGEGERATWTDGTQTRNLFQNADPQTIYNFGKNVNAVGDDWKSTYGFDAFSGLNNMTGRQPDVSPYISVQPNNNIPVQPNSNIPAPPQIIPTQPGLTPDPPDPPAYPVNNTSTPGYSNTPGQVTLPSMSMGGAPDWINDLSNSIPAWRTAFDNFSNLPSKIDNWSNEAMKYQRATGDQVTSILDQIGEQRAGSGVMGGTESNAIKARYLADFSKILNDNKLNIMSNANNMKSQAISALPGQAMSGIGAMTSLYGANAADQQNWANLAAQMINTGY